MDAPPPPPPSQIFSELGVVLGFPKSSHLIMRLRAGPVDRSRKALVVRSVSGRVVDVGSWRKWEATSPEAVLVTFSGLVSWGVSKDVVNRVAHESGGMQEHVRPSLRLGLHPHRFASDSSAPESASAGSRE